MLFSHVYTRIRISCSNANLLLLCFWTQQRLGCVQNHQWVLKTTSKPHTQLFGLNYAVLRAPMLSDGIVPYVPSAYCFDNHQTYFFGVAQELIHFVPPPFFWRRPKIKSPHISVWRNSLLIPFRFPLSTTRGDLGTFVSRQTGQRSREPLDLGFGSNTLPLFICFPLKYEGSKWAYIGMQRNSDPLLGSWTKVKEEQGEMPVQYFNIRFLKWSNSLFFAFFHGFCIFLSDSFLICFSAS